MRTCEAAAVQIVSSASRAMRAIAPPQGGARPSTIGAEIRASTPCRPQAALPTVLADAGGDDKAGQATLPTCIRELAVSPHDCNVSGQLDAEEAAEAAEADEADEADEAVEADGADEAVPHTGGHGVVQPRSATTSSKLLMMRIRSTANEQVKDDAHLAVRVANFLLQWSTTNIVGCMCSGISASDHTHGLTSRPSVINMYGSPRNSGSMATILQAFFVNTAVAPTFCASSSSERRTGSV